MDGIDIKVFSSSKKKKIYSEFNYKSSVFLGSFRNSAVNAI